MLSSFHPIFYGIYFISVSRLSPPSLLPKVSKSVAAKMKTHRLFKAVAAMLVLHTEQTTQQATDNHGVTFLYPTAGLTMYYMDNITVVYESNFSAPRLYTFCGNSVRKSSHQSLHPFSFEIPRFCWRFFKTYCPGLAILHRKSTRRTKKTNREEKRSGSPVQRVGTRRVELPCPKRHAMLV